MTKICHKGHVKGPHTMFILIGVVAITEPAPLSKLTPETSTPADARFGFTLSTWGKKLATGAWAEDYFAGAAYVFEQGESGWSQLARLQPLVPFQGSGFGSSVAVWDDMVVVGRPEQNFGQPLPGSAFVFKRTVVGFMQAQQLTASDGQSGDFFGLSVAIHKDVVAVGSPQDWNEGFIQSGSAYVFRTQDEGWTWSEEAKVTAAEPRNNRFFGFHLRLSADFLVVGAVDYDILPASDESYGSGAAFVFDRSWAHVATLEADDGGEGDEFGFDISLDDDMCIIGAPRRGNAGAVYIFDTKSWLLEARLVSSDPKPLQSFGRNIVANDKFIGVGANVIGANDGDPGSVEVFRRNTTEHVGTIRATTSNDFGTFLAFADDGLLFVSAPLEPNDRGNVSGAIFTYQDPGSIVVVRNGTLPDEDDVVADGDSSSKKSNYSRSTVVVVSLVVGLVVLVALIAWRCCRLMRQRSEPSKNKPDNGEYKANGMHDRPSISPTPSESTVDDPSR